MARDRTNLTRRGSRVRYCPDYPECSADDVAEQSKVEVGWLKSVAGSCFPEDVEDGDELWECRNCQLVYVYKYSDPLKGPGPIKLGWCDNLTVGKGWHPYPKNSNFDT